MAGTGLMAQAIRTGLMAQIIRTGFVASMGCVLSATALHSLLYTLGLFLFFYSRIWVLCFTSYILGIACNACLTYCAGKAHKTKPPDADDTLPVWV